MERSERGGSIFFGRGTEIVLLLIVICLANQGPAQSLLLPTKVKELLRLLVLEWVCFFVRKGDVMCTST